MRGLGLLLFFTPTVLFAPVSGPMSAAPKDAPAVQPTSLRMTFPTRDARLGEKARLEQMLAADSGQGSAERVQTLIRLAEFDLLLYDGTNAGVAASQALAAARNLKQDGLLIDALITSARAGVTVRKGDYPGQSQLEEAVKLSDHSHNTLGKARALVEQCAGLNGKERSEDAIAAGEQARDECIAAHDRVCEARANYLLGAPNMVTGQYGESEGSLTKAATIWNELSEHFDRAETLLDHIFLDIREGQLQKALELLSQVNAVVTDPDVEPYLAAQMNVAFGEIYDAYGQLEKALLYFRQARQLYQQADKQAAALDALRLADRVEARLGNYVTAANELQDCIKSTKEPLYVALCRDELGRIELGANHLPEAREQFKQVIKLYDKPKRPREGARTQAFLAQTLYQAKDLVGAEAAYNRALEVFQHIEDRNTEAAIQFGLGKVKLDQGDLDQAGQHLERSIKLTEDLRENASSTELRSSYLASVHDRYDTYVDWQMQEHERHPEEGDEQRAFEAFENGRARALLDAIGGFQLEVRAAANTDQLTTESQLLARERYLLDQRSKIEAKLVPETSRPAIDQELISTRASLDALQAEMNSGSSGLADPLQIKPLKLEEIKASLISPGTSLFEYFLGERQSYLWVVSADHRLQTFKLPPKDEIEKLANQAVGHAQDSTADNSLDDDLKQLSTILLGPAAGQIPRDRMIVVADGPLQYVPFAALTTPDGQPLIAHCEVINAASASTQALSLRAQPNPPTRTKLLAAFGDPVIDAPPTAAPEGAQPAGDRDARVLHNLNFASRELNLIQDTVGSDADMYTGFAATRENLQNADLSHYQILHIASHGIVDKDNPALSRLALSRWTKSKTKIDGFISLADIYGMKTPVDLVVLSACSTGTGQIIRGEGLASITRGFMLGGARSVVASLWNVDDQASAELMHRFYENMLVKGMPTSAALTAAQNSIRSEPQWHSPHYWAAFTLQGDYRLRLDQRARSRRSFYLKLVAGALGFIALVGIFFWWRRRRSRSRHAI